MVVRTTADNVKEIVEVDEDIELTAFIKSANELVTEYCTGTKGPVPVYTEERLELIERWLAAHFYRIRDQAAASETAAGVGGSFQYKIGMGLESTMWGAQALRLDTNKGLSVHNKSATDGKSSSAGVLWLGS